LELSPVASRAYPSEFATLYRAGMTSVVLHCLFMQQNQLPVTDAVGLAYLHRHAAARAAVAVAGNYNRLSSFHVPLIFDGTTYLVKSLSLAAVRRSAIAELAGPALEFQGVIERMMLPKFLGRLKAE
jgi:hypothetical protein